LDFEVTVALNPLHNEEGDPSALHQSGPLRMTSFHTFAFFSRRRIFTAMDSTNRDAVNELLQTYGETGGINYLDAAATLPSRLAIEAACAELMSLMFPGFRSEALVSSEDLADTTRTRIRNLHARLKTEICRSLGKIPPDETTEAKAEEVLSTFLKELPLVRRVLWTDIDAAYEGDPAAMSYEEIILAYPSLEAIAIHRMAHLLYNKVPLIPRIMTEWAHSRTGIDIHPGAEIGSHFFIDHGTGVVIGETTKIGARVKLYHAVTLGARSFQKDEHGKIKKGGKRHPTVEDDVTIYPGSTILGGETVIGARSTIGGNAFLTQSVPPDSLVYYEEKQLRIVPKRKHKSATTRDEFRE
jgi:serine O-acetyltransferase